MPTALTLLVLLAVPALADCPPDCVAGGGPAATDCFVVWSGIASTTFTCTDGTSCDTDGAADGVCTLGLQACINVPSPGCMPGGLDASPIVKPAKNPIAQALTSALAVLDRGAQACTPPGLVLPIGMSLRGFKPGKARLTVTATSAGKKDKDKLKLACAPSATPPSPSYAAQIQPIFSEKCAYSGCHDRFFKGGASGLVLEPDVAYASLVGAPAALGKRLRVAPGNLKASELVHRLLGEAIPRLGTVMPQGCPGFPPEKGCLTDQEIFTILSWVAGNAPNN